MPAKKTPGTSEAGLSSDLFQERNRLTQSTGRVVPEELDARLLWQVVCILATRSASIQLGVTRDGSAWAVQYWDGKFPIKEYFNSTDALNRSLAALIRAAMKRDVSPEWDEILSAYGW